MTSFGDYPIRPIKFYDEMADYVALTDTGYCSAGFSAVDNMESLWSLLNRFFLLLDDLLTTEEVRNWLTCRREVMGFCES